MPSKQEDDEVPWLAESDGEMAINVRIIIECERFFDYPFTVNRTTTRDASTHTLERGIARVLGAGHIRVHPGCYSEHTTRY